MKNLQKKPIRQLIKFSNYSLCTTLPKEYVDALGWKQGDSISFSLNPEGTNLVITKLDNPPTLLSPVSIENQRQPLSEPVQSESPKTASPEFFVTSPPIPTDEPKPIPITVTTSTTIAMKESDFIITSDELEPIQPL